MRFVHVPVLKEAELLFALKNESCSVLADVDGYDDLDELFRDLHTYFFVLENLAEISVIRKGLIISDKLKKDVKKTELSNFDHVVKDGIVFGV